MVGNLNINMRAGALLYKINILPITVEDGR